MSKLPDFEGLAIFAKVLQMQSFARAAAELQLSKATVSKAVSRLEAKFGARLFNRTSRWLSLAEAGKQLAERAAHILAEGAASAGRQWSRDPAGLRYARGSGRWPAASGLARLEGQRRRGQLGNAARRAAAEARRGPGGLPRREAVAQPIDAVGPEPSLNTSAPCADPDAGVQR